MGGNMPKRLILSLLGLLLSATVLVVGCPSNGDAPATPTPAEPVAPDTSGEMANEVRIVHKENPYQFEPNELSFEVGKTYNLVMGPDQTEFHTFTVDDLGIDLVLNAGDNLTHTFTPDKAGEFHLFCIPHQAFGMTGTITVK